MGKSARSEYTDFASTISEAAMSSTSVLTKSYSVTSNPPSTVREDERIYDARKSGTLESPERAFKLIDLFSGAGGMSLGFTGFGLQFQSVWANDWDKDCVATYNLNFSGHNAWHGDLVTALEDSTVEVPKADVVIGGPPCQGFSLLNKNRQGDERRELWRQYLEVVERSEASIFVMENVPQLLDSEEFAAIGEKARSLGFKLTSAKLLAADYGVSQTRTRAFIVGCKSSDPAALFPPKRTHYDPKHGLTGRLFSELGAYIQDPLPWRTVKDEIGALEPPIGTEVRDIEPPYDLHFGRTPSETSLKRYRAIPDEGMNRFDLQRLARDLVPPCWIKKTSGGTDLFGRLWWDRPAFTIRTEFFKPEKGRYLHPVQHRPITHREAARLQSFPDTFRFSGSKISIAKQIGNAVPPLLAARVADAVYALLLARA